MAARLRTKIIKLDTLQIPTDFNPMEDGVTQSLLMSFLACRIAYLININRYRKVGGGLNASYGNIMHYLLENLYSYWDEEGNLPTRKKLNRWLEKYTKEFADELQDLPEDQIERRMAQSEIMMLEYMKFYDKDFKTTNRFFYLEKCLQVRFGAANDFLLKMKCDGLIKSKDKSIWLFEHKTRSRIMEETIKAILSYDFQSLFYITCIQMKLKKSLSGVMYNVIRNPGHGKKIKSLKAYQKNLQKEINKNPGHFFKRYPQAYTIKDKDTFVGQLWNILCDLRRFHSGELGIYRNQNCCQREYRCDFLPACSTGQLQGYRKVNELFSELEDKYVKRF